MIIKSFLAAKELDEAIDTELDRVEDEEGFEQADQLRDIIATLIQRIYRDPEMGSVVAGLPNNYRKLSIHPLTMFYWLDRRIGKLLLYLLQSSDIKLSGREHRRQVKAAKEAAVDFSGYAEEA